MPRHTEPSANDALGAALSETLPAFGVRSENTRQIVGSPNLRPDILIVADGRSPVVVEAEFMPARTAESEASERLGLEVVGAGARRIDAAIALRYPDDVGDADDLADAVRSAALSYAVLYADGSRFPKSGWLEGGVGELSDLIRLVSVPQSAVDAAADALERGIERAAAILESLDRSRPDAIARISALLGMDKGEQTFRMAGAIVANAMIFHERLAGGLPGADVPPLSTLCGEEARNPKGGMLSAWNAILRVNYWPIFALAHDILNRLPAAEASHMLSNLRETVEEVEFSGANRAQDLTGRIFQRLMDDRKFLAIFYTLPASASLLARLAVARLDVDWSDAAAVSALRVGDFACGTGALLSSVYERIASLHERGGDPAALHPAMMEDVLYGCDVMPSAIHITGSALSGAHPTVGFGKSRLYTLAYGRQDDGTVRIGSLDLLQSSATMTLFNTSDPARRTGSAGEETASQIIADVPDKGFDLVIMNPPFPSNTKHYKAEAGVVNAAFAAFHASPRDQSDMAKRMRRATAGTCYHGHAGMGSAFAELAHRKTKPGGIVAFVLPLTAINGPAWAKFRELMANNYADLTIVSIAANGRDAAFSSDTNMAECLIVGRKLANGETPDMRARFASLRRRPAGFVEASQIAALISQAAQVRRVEDGPYGGSPIRCGGESEGEILDAPISAHESGWGAVRIADCAVAQTAHALTEGKLWLPGQRNAADLPIAQLQDVGKRGLDHQLLISDDHKGPFTKEDASPTATYPSLWNHSAKKETRIVCEPDSQMRVKMGMEEKAAEIWATASRSHISMDFRFNSQPLAAAFTERETIGGTAWPNVIFDDERFDCAFAIWANSTLGLLAYWWHSSRQQDGRGRITMSYIETLPILDLRALTDAQLDEAARVFDDFRAIDLLPAYMADADPNRALLDRRLLMDVLGMDAGVYDAVRRLAAKWSAEPSVHGGKGRR